MNRAQQAIKLQEAEAAFRAIQTREIVLRTTKTQRLKAERLLHEAAKAASKSKS
jgi:hypothetical protein